MDDTFDFETAFQSIGAAMVDAAKARDHTLASAEAEKWGLVEQPHESLSAGWQWGRSGGNRTLIFRFRSYDQSKPFSPVLPDMNVLSLQFVENGVAIRTAEERYED